MAKYITTLGRIHINNPCKTGWDTLTKALGTVDRNTEVSLEFILKSNGIKDAVWALRCFPYKSICLFSADVAESVYKYTNDKTGVTWAAIQAVHYFHAEIVDEVYLRKAAYAAYADAYAAAAYAAAYSDAAAAAAAAYAAAAYAAAYSDAAAAAADAAYAAAYSDAAASCTNNWVEIEELFVKHFCQED